MLLRRAAPRAARLELEQLFRDVQRAQDQAKGPLVNPVEMAMPSHRAVEAAVNDDPDYRRLFAAAFDNCAITIDTKMAMIFGTKTSVISWIWVSA